ncbi:MAG: AAA family ATPase [Myxococcales bacterium]|nr:AAA family ATPase [Myxococcales bacterium]
MRPRGLETTIRCADPRRHRTQPAPGPSLDQRRLQDARRRPRPRLLVLDPFVRLHRIDENSAAEVSAVLAFLREVQRAHDTAVLVVHHARKNASGSAGQGLRGSGDFHAWTDSALYVRRRRGDLVVTVEHRAAAAPDPFVVGWSPSATHRRLRISSSRVTPKPSPPPSPAAPT